MQKDKQRVIFYVDGFNFYYGLKSKKWRKFYWLDIVNFFESFLKPHQELVEVKYFSAVQTKTDKADRQDMFFTANKQNDRFKLYLGKYQKKILTCRNCKDRILLYEEKETDVRIATQMISDVTQNKCDITVLVSADSDLIPPIEAIREFDSKHKVWTYFPPHRRSNNLINISNLHVHLERHSDRFNKSILPNEIEINSGYVIKRPEHWN
jgi:uncharacterized LabA/DUF88 family protein